MNKPPLMKRCIPLLVILLALLSSYSLFGQCYYQNQPDYYYVHMPKAYAIAVSNNGRAAVSSLSVDSSGKRSVIKIWNDVADFTGGLDNDDSIVAISVTGLAYDGSDNLYVVQRDKTDSNVQIYNSSLALIKTINNTTGSSLEWTKPRSIAIDGSGSAYIVSDDSISHADHVTVIPGTGKLLKITDPLGAAVKTVALSNLSTPKGVAINGSILYLTEYDSNRITTYNLPAFTAIDSATAAKPMDVITKQCRTYASSGYLNGVGIYNASALADTSVTDTIAAIGPKGKFGLAIDGDNNLLVCDNDSNRVLYYEGVTPIGGSSGGDCHCGVFCMHTTYNFPMPGSGWWISADTNIVTIDSFGHAYGKHQGGTAVLFITPTDTLHYTAFIDSPIAPFDPIHARGNFGNIFDSVVICSKHNRKLYDNMPFGGWYSSNSYTATITRSGVLWPKHVGTTTISHFAGNSCNLIEDTFHVRVVNMPILNVITGDSLLCTSTPVDLDNATSGGYWHTADAGIASVDSISGLVSGHNSGYARIIYTIEPSCEEGSAYFSVKVDTTPIAGTIYGTDSVCVHATTALYDTTGTHGGKWTSGTTSIATVDSLTGVVTGVAEGSATIYYAVKSACDSVFASFVVRVNDKPHGSVITGPDSICVGSAITLSGTPSAWPHWESSNFSIALALGSSGFVYGQSAGTATIFYFATNYCGVDTAMRSITVVPQPYSGNIVCNNSYCLGDDDNLQVDSIIGNVEYWYSDEPWVADATPWSHLYCNGVGSNYIHHISYNQCGADTSSFYVTVNPLPTAGMIIGPDSVCSGSNIALVDYGSSDPGYWYSADYSIADVDAMGNVIGTATMASGTSIVYHVDNSCGSDEVAHVVYVNALPDAGTISGPSTICHGATALLSGVMPGGVWSTSDPGVVTVSSSGVIGGAAYLPSAATISYTVATYSCGSAYSSLPVSVLMPPNAGFITGADSLCINSFDTVRNHAATPGGTWRSRYGRVQFLSATSGIDTVMFKGIVAGNDTLVYTVTNSCGTDSVLFHLRVNALPVPGFVEGPLEVCVSSSISLSDPTGTPGGVWTSSATGIASVDPATGVVTGISPGSADIIYSGSSACGVIPDIHTVTVDELPYTVLSTPAASICQGNTFTLTSTYSPYAGSWSTSDAFVATVDAVTGVITALNAGSATISYTLVSPLCGSYTATTNIVVNPTPSVTGISGLDSVCSGTSITLSDITPGGTWISSSSSTAAVTSGGVVTGAGTILSTATIYYIVSSASCGSDTAFHSVTVKPQPDAGIIFGPTEVCVGNNIFLSTTGTGGVWSSSLPLLATVNSVGMATGATAGTTTISYTATNSCGTTYATAPVAVLTVPAMPSVSGADSFCVGTVSSFTGTPASGTWSFYYGFASVISETASIANLYASYAGYDTVYYTITNACGSATAGKPIHLLTLPYTGYILAGADSLCPGNTTTVTDPSAAGGGIWGHTGSSISVTTTGVITALAPGTDAVLYTLTNSCGSVAASRSITVHQLPVAGSISGPAGICIGSSTSLTNTGGTPGGTWGCSAGSITSAGVFTGSSAGTVTITYTASTACGNAYAYFAIVVNPLPTVSAITMPSSICSGASVTASDATPGGFWSVSSATVATVTSLTGVVTALSVGSATITYSVTNLCGTSAVIHPLAVQALPSAFPIIGVPNVCPGSTSVLTSGPAGGTWSASNGHATISSSGLLTGISAGIDTISYSITNSCGTATALRIATIYPVPGTDTISGSSIACIGIPVTLTAAVPGGVWTSAGGHTTVTAGAVYGLSTGVDTIRYAETNSCGSAILTHLMTVHDTVSASVTASVSPNDTICGAAPVMLTASLVNGGTSPNVVWYNGALVLGTGISLSYTPSDGDIVHCSMMSNAVCPTPTTAYSNNIGLEVYPNVIPAVIVTTSPSDTVAFIGQSITFTATLTNCGSSPVYQWYENGTAITGATNATYTTTAAGSDAYYCIAACDTPCAIAVYNHSNVVTLYTGHVGVPGISNMVAQYSVAPNPNTGTFVLDGHGIRTNDDIRYDVLDVAGRQVINGRLQPVNGRIRNEVVMPDVAAGQYILRVFDGAAVVVFRIDLLK